MGKYVGARNAQIDDAIQTSHNALFCTGKTYVELGTGQDDISYTQTIAASLRVLRIKKHGNGRCGVVRSWDDIRGDTKEFLMMWFPVKGFISVEQDNQQCVADANSFVRCYSNRPYKVEMLAEDGYCEVYHVVVPTYEINTYLPHLTRVSGKSVSTEAPASAIARATFIHLHEHGDELAAETNNTFVSAALTALSDVLSDECASHLSDTNIKTVRLKGLFDYIDCHLSDPGLNANRVASECGMSTRYLYLLFKEAEISFHSYVWGKRLERAYDWLTNDKDKQQTIEHVARMVGFRSVSHFSRLFKKNYGCTPCQARKLSPESRAA